MYTELSIHGIIGAVYILLYISYGVQCTVCIQFKVYIVQCTVYSLQFTVYSVQLNVDCAQYTIYSAVTALSGHKGDIC